MPFVRRLIFKGENNCEMAQQHWNRLVFFDQYFHPPSVEWKKKKKNEQQIYHYHLSCVQIQKRDRLWHSGRQPYLFIFFFSFNASLAWLGPVRKHVLPDLLSTGTVVLTAFYAVIAELLIRSASHWWTNAVPYQQYISSAYSITLLIWLSFAQFKKYTKLPNVDNIQCRER